MALKCPECGTWRKTAYGLYCHVLDKHTTVGSYFNMANGDIAWETVEKAIENSKEDKSED